MGSGGEVVGAWAPGGSAIGGPFRFAPLGEDALRRLFERPHSRTPRVLRMTMGRRQGDAEAPSDLSEAAAIDEGCVHELAIGPAADRARTGQNNPHGAGRGYRCFPFRAAKSVARIDARTAAIGESTVPPPSIAVTTPSTSQA